MADGALARLQAAVARWPHLRHGDHCPSIQQALPSPAQPGPSLLCICDVAVRTAQIVSPSFTYHHPAECARLGGRCALDDADLAAVGDAAQAFEEMRDG